MAKRVLVLLVALGLANCGNKPAADIAATTGSVTSQPAVMREAAPVADAPMHTGAAFIAYSYKLGFELPARRIDEVVRAHQSVCEKLGPARCQLLNSSRTGGDGDAANASLELRVAPAIVKSFTAQLETSTAGAGGRVLESATTGEDITRQLIDADAVLKAKRTLRNRLQILLEHHEGRLADLLALEKSLSGIQQELDTATAELAELQQRVSFSKLDISYRSEHPFGSTARPLAEAVANAGQTISGSLAALLTFSLAILPWLVPLGLIVFLLQRWRRHLRGVPRAGLPPLAL